MYTIRVEAHFSATHRLRLSDGELEPLHGHDWRVRAYFARRALDDSGMVVDFEVALATLRSVLESFHHRCLNDHEGFVDLNPTAEAVATVVFQRLVSTGLRSVRRVDVFEAPGCVATYKPETDP